MIFPKYKMGKDNRYGPTPHNRFYQPAYYHNPVDAKNGKGKKAKQREHEDKTHWVLKKPEQYHVFLTGDINELFDDRGIYSVLDNCKVVFGEDCQRIAIFETPRNDTWHGFPIFSWEKPISDAIVIKMKDKGLISEVTKQRIIDHRI